MSLSSVLRTLTLTLNPTLKRTPRIRFYSSKAPRQGVVKERDPTTGEVKTKKTTMIPKITLISGDDVSVSTIQEAEKLAKRRDLKLVKIMDIDAKTQRPVFKLMTGAEYHAEDLKQREQRKLEKMSSLKGEKVLLINAKIARHDLDVQLKKAQKWVKKMYEVRVIISGAGCNPDTSEKIYGIIEQFFTNEEGDAKLTQKKAKGADIKFQIVPPKYKERSDSL